MGIVVQKYGGSSVADAQGIKRVAQRIVATKKAGHDVCVVVSAMGDTTDELRELAQQVSPVPPGRELDMLLTAGERISMALLAMAIANLGQTARRSPAARPASSPTPRTAGRRSSTSRPAGSSRRSPTVTSRSSPGSRASRWRPRTSRRSAEAPPTPPRSRWPRRSSAEVCEIYSDVDGIFTADPRIVPMARQIPHVSYEEMLEMCASGAKILHLRCVEYARRYHMPIHVRSSFSQKARHLGRTPSSEGEVVEQAIIAGVTHDRSEAKITVVGCPGQGRRGGPDLRGARRRGHQHRHDRAEHLGRLDTAAPTSRSRCRARTAQVAMKALSRLQDEVGFEQLLYDDRIGKVSLVGAGMRTPPRRDRHASSPRSPRRRSTSR